MSRYTALDAKTQEVRLLSLSPGNFTDPIVCTMTTASLQSRPEYSALSYVWGNVASANSSANTFDLDAHPVSATFNLLAALRHIRPSMGNQPLRIWVDAVCINQQDVNERNQQVSMMRDIYACAEQVLIWLGAGDEASDAALDAVPVISTAFGIQDKEKRKQLFGVMHSNSSFFFGLAERFPWFSRIWILQEMALARKDPLVICGQKSTSWSALIKAWDAIARETFAEMGMMGHGQYADNEGKTEHNSNTSEEMRKIDTNTRFDTNEEFRPMLKVDVLNELREMIQSKSKLKLSKLLRISRTSESTDPRDRIYGLLGLLKDDNQATSIVVDYQKPTSEVYTDAMAHIFSLGEGPYFLSGIFLPGVDFPAPHIASLPPNIPQPDLPSWVPDFSRQTADKANQSLGILFHPPAGAGTGGATGAGANCHNGKQLEDKITLQAEGLVVDAIEQVIPLGDSLDSCIQSLSSFEAIVAQAINQPCSSRVNNSLVPYIQRFKASEPLWKILISNKSFNSGYDPAPSTYEEAYQNLLQQKDYVGHQQESAPDTDRSEYELCLKAGIGKRAIFVSQNGFVGTCVPDARHGDIATIIFGSPTAFVLRPAQKIVVSGKELLAHTLIGGAYVGGIMDGKMVDELYCEDLMDSTTFYIR